MFFSVGDIKVIDPCTGPYYVSGEYVREDLREDQEGVPLWLDLQFIDVSTCSPVSAGIFVDVGHSAMNVA